ncbi:phosphoribosylanthranilate isomerase [Gracilibacillus salitolerans]|uniref:N-(5'-phosphoribosyl)anthranilate isomerase n=1 Tax=Gracilibacillus salitolerans TaxID=2663022 RepID=A0A5Q2TP10_9BACI|nr:phosphoribosylanthranilate isomerase [Gracilibacillus salitolerans]QGH36465.1 phosphoribosylanthranilate isomerase [Gracilibacillus salitolerans]
MVQVKICGLQNEEAIQAAAGAGADFIGFVFAKSKRRVTKEQASKLARFVPSHVKKVGVFVNESIETIQEIAYDVGLDYVQLHGDESPAFCQEVGLPVIKAFEVRQANDLDNIADYDCAYYLLDSPAGKYRGGSGETFDWSIAKEYDFLNKKILLAGGLKVGNIEDAIKEVSPAGVDVSSGVETDDEKDLNKIKAFIDAAKKGDGNGELS